MNSREYERIKFDLAAILRSVQHRTRANREDSSSPFVDLFARLADDRFNLVVAGRFNQGKTSLMNALLESQCLPVGVVPVTSVITTVTYGTEEEAIIEYHGRRIPERVSLERLCEYVSEEGNAGNVRGVTTARVFMPAELLRQGFYFVDTPGLGSASRENTQTTQAFLPEADAVMLVTSYESVLSEEEMELLKSTMSSNLPLFIVVNKSDVVAQCEREEILRCIHGELFRVTDAKSAPPIISVSARMALCAMNSGDGNKMEKSGVPVLRRELAQFFLRRKREEFLKNMCARVAAVLGGTGDVPLERGLLDGIRRKLESPENISKPDGVPKTAPFCSCTICDRIVERTFEILRTYQYAIIVNAAKRREGGDNGDLCAFHLWQYYSLASSYGICVGLSSRLEQLAKRLRDSSTKVDANAGFKDMRLAVENCEVCRARSEIEVKAFCEIVDNLTENYAPTRMLCLPHLRSLLESLANGTSVQELTLMQANALERVADDMHRYAMKMDANRRSLLTTEERSADMRALSLLAGHPVVFGPAEVT